MNEFHWLPSLLQTSDPLFPTGAYAHSLGFEETVRLRIVRDESSLREFLLEQIVPAQREQELPYVRFAFEAAATGDLAELRRIDLEVSAWKLACEARAASAQLGSRRLKALCAISGAPLLHAFEQMTSRATGQSHHVVVCGLQAVVEQVPLDAALSAALYQALSAICAAAMKLIRIGQDAVQRVLRSASTLSQETIERSLRVSRGSAGWFNPLLEVASLRHQRADERLFIS